MSAYGAIFDSCRLPGDVFCVRQGVDDEWKVTWVVIYHSANCMCGRVPSMATGKMLAKLLAN